MKKIKEVVNVTSIVCTLLFALAASGADRVWNGSVGDGEWTTAGNWDGDLPGTGDVAVFNSDASGGIITVEVSNNTTVQQIRVSGTADVVVNIAQGTQLTVSNAGGTGIQAQTANITLNGPGLLGVSTAGGYNHLDSGALPGFTLTYNARIVDPSGGTNTGLEAYVPNSGKGGTVVFTDLLNTFALGVYLGNGHIAIVPTLANNGTPCSIGAGPSFLVARGSILRYTGTGDTTDRIFGLVGGDATIGYGGGIEHAGTGTLTWGGPVFNTNNSTQVFTLMGDSASEARVSGSIYNEMGTLAVRKEGTGTWVLSGNNTFTGGLTVNGGTLGLDSPTAFGGSAQITMAAGTALSLNPSGTDGFAVTLPRIVASGSIALSIADAKTTTSTVMLNGLNGSFSVAISAPGAGTAANTILVQGLPVGLVGAWLTLNGGPAEYDPVNGLSPAALTTADGIAVKGGTLPDDPNANAVIDTAAINANPIALTGNPVNALYTLTMAFEGDDAVVDTAAKTLIANKVAIAADADALTIGLAPQDGTLLPPLAAVALDASTIAALGPTIWYDPSDSATLTLNGTTVTGIANKGTFGATHNAVVRSGWTGPTLVTGNDSHASLPMLQSSADSRGLQSAANSGISGNAPRTLIAVMSRDNQCIVSIGAGTARQAFEVYLNGTTSIRFGAYSADIDITPGAPAETPVVMTFFNGVGGNLNAYQGFADGIASTVRFESGGLVTTATPLHLMHRNGSTSSGYRGQIGEVMLFNRTLNEVERQIVEAYLMTKWQQATPTPLEAATLALSNDSDAPLTINAAITPPPDSTVSLVKTGTGNAILAGGATLSGTVLINEGALTVATPDTATDTLGPINGAGKLVKDGPGTLLLPYSIANLHTGGTDILGGTLTVGNNTPFGTGPVVIADGATLDVGTNPILNGLTLSVPAITVSGAGVGGQGAIVNNGPQAQQNLFLNTTVTLDGPTAFGGTTRWDFRSAGATLDLNGEVLTKVGTANLVFSGTPGSTILNAPAGTAIDVQAGGFTIESGMTLNPNNSQRNLNLAAGALMGLYAITTPVHWTLTTGDNAEIQATQSNATTNQNTITGAVTLNGTLRLTAGTDFNKVFSGEVSGNGGLSVYNGGSRAMSLLAHPANTFTGPVAVSNACLGLFHFGSLPSLSKLQLAPNAGHVRVYMGESGGWTSGQVKQLAECGQFVSSAAWDQLLQINVGAGESASFPALSGTLLGSVDKFGAGDLAFDHDTTLRWGLRTFGGGITFTNDATFALANPGTFNHIYTGDAVLGDGTAGIGSVLVGGKAKLILSDNGYNRNGPGIHIATHGASKIVMDVKDEAYVQARLTVGGLDNNANDATSVGAVYQSGNSKWLNTGGANNDSRIGRHGYGYYQLEDNAEMTVKGWFNIGNPAGTTSPLGIGMMRQTGGKFTFNGSRYTVPSGNNVGDSYNGRLDLSRGGIAVLHLSGGTFEHYGALNLLSDSTDLTYNNGTAIMTVDGDANVWIDRQIEMGRRNNGLAVLNLNGGTLTTTYLYRRATYTGTTPSSVFVNFNGGLLRVANGIGDMRLIAREGNTAHHLGAYVYAGGAMIDIDPSVTRNIDIPLQHPQSMGIASIPLASGGTGYVAPPHVAISGGNGTGATAIAHIDRLSGTVTHIEVTCPGFGYTTPPTVTLTGGGGTGASVTGANVVRTLNSGGGLTKTGGGTLTLSAANSYQGATRINGGTLLLAHPQAIPETSEIIIGDGFLNLGGNTITNVSVTITGEGGVVNGKIVTASAVKTGPGTATWDAGVEFKALSGTPGLYESHNITGASRNLTAPNTCVSIELTTTAANGYASTSTPINGKPWANNSIYIYTGYIWNRSPTNETWTFVEHFDDDVWLKIDDDVVLNDGIAGTLTTANYTLTPGPHSFEIRFGQGSGGVGRSNTSNWFNNNQADTTRGWAIDFLGRNSTVYGNYVLPVDPGDGSLFTVTIDEPDTAIRVEEGTLLIPSDTPGLWEGYIPERPALSANLDVTHPNPRTRIELTTLAANGFLAASAAINGKVWINNSTWVYTGYIWNRTGAPATWTFAKSFDDDVWIKINGTAYNFSGWNTITRHQIMLQPGPNAFEIRFAQGTGGVGAVIQTIGGFEWKSSTMPVGVDVQGRNEPVFENYAPLIDPGDGSLLTTTAGGNASDWLNGTVINVADGATLDLGGAPHAGLIITGNGTVINGVSGSGVSLSPAGDNTPGTMSVDGGSLDGVTYRVTIHDFAPGHYDNIPGLWEGRLAGSFNLTDPNPSTHIEPTTLAANGWCNQNGSINGKQWPDNSTYVYTGYIWNHTDDDVTWTFAENFDDNVRLLIDDKVVLSDIAWAVPTKNTITLTPGPHRFEVRFGQGAGGAGAPDPNGSTSSSWWNGFARSTAFVIDFQGRDSTDTADYQALTPMLVADVNGGPLFTLTKYIDPGQVSDVIHFTGAIDLTGLTIVPSDVISETPLKSKYVIATATGGFTGTPTIEGFTDGRKWLTLRKGTELWLTTPSMLIILR